MALKKFHLLKDRFLFDDYESGLYFDLWPVKRPAGDEDAFNAAIEAASDKLVETDPANQVWKPTLFLTDAQMYALPKRYQDSFSAKTYLLLFKSGFAGDKLPSTLWFDYGSGGMVCNPSGERKNWLFYTNWDANMLGHRFHRVQKAEVDAYVDPNAGEDETPGGGSTGGDTETPVVVGARIKKIVIPSFEILVVYEE